MGPDHEVKILFVEEDASVWPRAEAFFRYQLNLIGAFPDLHFRRYLPGRAAGFDVVSLDGRDLVSTLLEHQDLLADLRSTAILNLHANVPGPLYGQMRRLLDRPDAGRRFDGLWVFPQSWMAPWFLEALDFPELGLARITPTSAPRRPTPDRTWERRSIGALHILMGSPAPIPLRG
jgi:hypothetical protein